MNYAILDLYPLNFIKKTVNEHGGKDGKTAEGIQQTIEICKEKNIDIQNVLASCLWVVDQRKLNKQEVAKEVDGMKNEAAMVEKIIQFPDVHGNEHFLDRRDFLMAREIENREAKKPNVPATYVVGVDHLAGMSNLLRTNGYNVKLRYIIDLVATTTSSEDHDDVKRSIVDDIDSLKKISGEIQVVIIDEQRYKKGVDINDSEWMEKKDALKELKKYTVGKRSDEAHDKLVDGYSNMEFELYKNTINYQKEKNAGEHKPAEQTGTGNKNNKISNATNESLSIPSTVSTLATKKLVTSNAKDDGNSVGGVTENSKNVERKVNTEGRRGDSYDNPLENELTIPRKIIPLCKRISKDRKRGGNRGLRTPLYKLMQLGNRYRQMQEKNKNVALV